MMDYTSSIERVKKTIMDRHFDAVGEHLRKAASLDVGRAEAFKLLGVKLPGHRPGLPGNVISSHIVPLHPTHRVELAGHAPVIMEVRGDRVEAQKNYRAALSVDPSHKPAILNLQRSSSGRRSRTGGVQFGDDRKAKPVDK